MIKELKTAKWYWFIPLVSLYYIGTMSSWMMFGKTKSSVNYRQFISILNCVFPNVFIFVYFILKIRGY